MWNDNEEKWGIKARTSDTDLMACSLHFLYSIRISCPFFNILLPAGFLVA